MCEQIVNRVLNVKRGRLRTLLGEHRRTCCGRAEQLKEWASGYSIKRSSNAICSKETIVRRIVDEIMHD